MHRRKRIFRFFRPDIAADVDDELRFHLEARIADYEARGCSHGEAERLARERFGDPERVRRALEVHDRIRRRQKDRREYMGQLLHDARIALRGLRRTPAFALVVLATLAVGIGVNAAIFSVVSRVLIDPLPYFEPSRLVLLYSANARESRGFVSPSEIDQLQHSSGSLRAVAAFGLYSGYTYIGDRETSSWQGVSVGPNFFRTLGVRAAQGRLIDERDVDGGAAKVVVLSHDLWRQAFGGDPSIVGRTIRLGEARWTVIGVTARDFAPPARAPQLWTPLDVRQFLGTRAASAHMLQAVARLADGATLAQARAEVRVVGDRAAAQDAPSPAPLTLAAVPIRDAIVGDVRPMLLVVMGAALVVLALACVNVAGLFLSRATARGRDIAVRAALGAGRWRIVRQLVTETTMLGIGGGAVGMLLAYWSRGLLVRLGARVLPVTGAPPSTDARIVVLGFLASLAIGLAAGLIPALVAARGGLTGPLADSTRAATGGRAGVRAGRVLVASQMALAVLLLVGAGLLGRTLFALERTNLGFDASDHVLSVTIALPRSYGTPDRQVQFFRDCLARVRGLSGVEAAGVIGISPWNGWNHETIQVERGPGGAPASITVPLGRVSDGYFAAVGTSVLEGRVFADSDRAGSLPVAVVSERFARLAWPGRDPIGQRIQIDGVETAWRTVVGVAVDVRENATSDVDAAVYVPAWQSPQRWYEMLVRASGDATSVVPAVRDEVRAIDPTLPVLAPRTLSEIVSAALAGTRMPVIFTAAFASLALVLAALGIYGVVAYSVTLRTRELGIRAALGGSRGDIVSLVLREGLGTAVAGTAAGVALAVAGSRLLTKLLYGVTAHDPVTFAAAAGVLLAASAAASYGPARRATRINPVDALRAE